MRQVGHSSGARALLFFRLGSRYVVQSPDANSVKTEQAQIKVEVVLFSLVESLGTSSILSLASLCSDCLPPHTGCSWGKHGCHGSFKPCVGFHSAAKFDPLSPHSGSQSTVGANLHCAS